jgi:hypothetical protein
MNTFSRFLRWLMLACLMLGASYALAAKTYSDNGDKTVTDPTTGLTWMRCAWGQPYNEATNNCDGNPIPLSWTDAEATKGTDFAGHKDWRLPTIRELLTIVDRSRKTPATNTVAFPAAPFDKMTWSSSAITLENKEYAWGVNFWFGDTAYSLKKPTTLTETPILGVVRLVRNDPTSPTAAANAALLRLERPNSDYQLQDADKSVLHVPTGLIWLKCAVWSNDCKDTPNPFNFAEATSQAKMEFNGHKDWRIPTADELLSLVDFKLLNHAINATMFPNSQGGYFFSSSLVDGNVNSPWFVHFWDGKLTGNPDPKQPDSLYSLRLVRGGNPDVSVTLTVDKPAYGEVNSSALVGIKCGPTSTLTCSNSFTQNTVVKLTATPANLFQSWSGDCTGSDPTNCTVTMNAAKKVQANFYPTISVPEKWSMWGNGRNAVMKVADYLSNAEVVGSVWTWDVKTGWRFYDPSKTAQDLQTFAAARNWSVLTQINPGEGFWVNAKKAFDMKQPSGIKIITASDFKEGNSLALAKNWNLVAVGDEPLPTKFNADIGVTPPGTEPVDNITSLWTWDNLQSKWYFYSPSKEREGTEAVAKFLSDKGYLDATSKKLGANIGFWVLKP